MNVLKEKSRKKKGNERAKYEKRIKREKKKVMVNEIERKKDNQVRTKIEKKN